MLVSPHHTQVRTPEKATPLPASSTTLLLTCPKYYTSPGPILSSIFPPFVYFTACKFINMMNLKPKESICRLITFQELGNYFRWHHHSYSFLHPISCMEQGGVEWGAAKFIKRKKLGAYAVTAHDGADLCPISP